MSGEDIAASYYQISDYRGCARCDSITALLLRISDRRWLETVKDDVIKCFVIINVWYYSYAFVFHPGYLLLCRRQLHALKSLTNNQVNMRVFKNQIML